MPVSDWADLFPATVTIAPYVSRGTYGARTFGTAVSYSARVINKTQRVMAPDGTERIATGAVWILGTPIVTAEDQITLPDGSTPSILSVQPIPDQDGAHHVKVLFQ